MRGGKRFCPRTRCAPKFASGLLGGMLITPWAAAGVEVRAAEAETAPTAAVSAEGCETGPREKSIVNSTRSVGDAAGANGAESTDGLRPIARNSEREPDLADPPANEREALVPTLAEEYLEVATDGDQAATASADEDATQNAGADEVSAADLPDEICDENEACAKLQRQSPRFRWPASVAPRLALRRGRRLLQQWGQPMSDAASGQKLVYAMAGFSAVTVNLVADRVESLRIELPEALSPAQLVDKLGLTGVRPAVLTDAAGVAVSTAYPERGVTFVHRAADASAVATDGGVARGERGR